MDDLAAACQDRGDEGEKGVLDMNKGEIVKDLKGASTQAPKDRKGARGRQKAVGGTVTMSRHPNENLLRKGKKKKGGTFEAAKEGRYQGDKAQREPHRISESMQRTEKRNMGVGGEGKGAKKKADPARRRKFLIRRRHRKSSGTRKQ